MAGTEQLSILACQIDVPSTKTELDRNMHLERLTAEVRAQLQRGPVDLVVLPELSSIEYSRGAFENLDRLAEPIDGVSFARWSGVSKEFETHVAYNFPRIDNSGQHRITLAVTGPDGRLIGYYDKIHLAQFGASMEKEFFQPGRTLFTFQIAGFTLAPIICADIRFPDLCRTLTVDHGAEIILHPGVYPRDPSFFSWHHFALTRALENQVYFVSLNRAGAEYGASLFSPPWIDDKVQPTYFDTQNEQFFRLIVERSELTLAREQYPFLKDRLDGYSVPVATSTAVSG